MSLDADASVIAKEPCPDCGSKDNLVRYDDGHAYCFTPGCARYEPGHDKSGEPGAKRPKADFKPIIGEFRALNTRRITEETCKKFGYRVGQWNEKTVHIAPYFAEDGSLAGQKIRFPDKSFTVLGSVREAGLFGQHISWPAYAKRVVITEGEIDAMSVSQIQDNKWPVVSLKGGAGSARRDVAAAFDWLNKFEGIILLFDNDEPGRKASEEAAKVLPLGKTRIGRLEGFKDPSEALQNRKPGDILTAIHGAKPWRPDGVIAARSSWDLMINDDEAVSCIPYPWDGLNDLAHGMRQGELVVITAGSGIGKSTLCREIAYHLIKRGERVGFLMLEESIKRTLKGLMGLALNKLLHLDFTPWSSLDPEDQKERRAAYQELFGNDRVYLLDHWGSTDIDTLESRIRYMSSACECKWIILDHISIVVSGTENEDERKLLDLIMTRLRKLVEETKIGLFVVSHLKRPEGKGHEEGARVQLGQLRGSHAIAQLSDMVIGAERNQQGGTHNQATLRVLKNRFTGQTGEAPMTPSTEHSAECVTLLASVRMSYRMFVDTRLSPGWVWPVFLCTSHKSLQGTNQSSRRAAT